jgi:Rod binding domain-containing protein
MVNHVLGPAFGDVTRPRSRSDEDLRRAAQSLEAAFLAEMFAHVGLDKALSARSGFGGEAYAGLFLEAYARRLAEAGGVGLAEKLYAEIKRIK